MEILGLGAIANPMYGLKGPKIIKGDHAPNFPLRWAKKDMDFGKHASAPDPCAPASAGTLRASLRRAPARQPPPLPWTSVSPYALRPEPTWLPIALHLPPRPPAIELAAELGERVPLAVAATAEMAIAVDEGFGDEDFSAVAKPRIKGTETV